MRTLFYLDDDDHAGSRKRASTFADHRPDPGWGDHYGDGQTPNYMTPQGPVWMFRKRQSVRFYDITGSQVGPEQSNVAPAVAYAHSAGWQKVWGSEQRRTAMHPDDDPSKGLAYMDTAPNMLNDAPGVDPEDFSDDELPTDPKMASRKFAWTEDGSDITPMAQRLMDLTDKGTDREAWNSEVDGYRLSVERFLAEQIRPFVSQITEADRDVLEDYNYHVTNRAIDRALGKMASRKQAVAVDDDMSGHWVEIDGRKGTVTKSNAAASQGKMGMYYWVLFAGQQTGEEMSYYLWEDGSATKSAYFGRETSLAAESPEHPKNWKKVSSRKTASRFAPGDRVSVTWRNGSTVHGQVTEVDTNPVSGVEFIMFSEDGPESDLPYPVYTNENMGQVINKIASRKTAMPAPADLGISVGDIFSNSWGYDQTQIDYYKVVRLTPAGVEIVPIGQRFVERNGPGGDSVVPDPNVIRDYDVITGIGVNGNGKKSKVCRVKDFGWGASIVLSDRHSATKWGGRPGYQTDTMFGR